MGVDILKRWLCALILGLTATVACAAPPQKILVLGDSLSAEYGLVRGTGWVALLEQKLDQEKMSATVVNASISGETTSGGLARLPALLRTQKPTIVIVELGANDALRGMAMTQTEKNLSQLVSLSQGSGAKVLLLGMQVPPNMGASYAKAFTATYARVAAERKVARVPFLLKGIADTSNSRELFQPDGIHPVAAAHPTMLLTVWVELRKLLQ